MANPLKAGVLLITLSVCICWGEDQYCPKTISTKQSLESVPSGWTAFTRKTDQALAGITFFDGPPEQEASLVYDSFTKGKTVDRAVWHFNRSSHIWVSCSYQGSTIVLSKALPAATTECRVSYSPGVHVDGYPEIKEVVCK